LPQFWYVKRICLYISCLLLPLTAAAQVTFTSVDSALAYADRNSSVTRVSADQKLLARWTKVAALANTVNFRNPVNFSATDNLLLPVNFIPAEAFGGPAGSYRQITLGQQYVSAFSFNPQIDIINPANWARVKSASLNKELAETSAQLARKALLESVSAAYFNIISLQMQASILSQNLSAADSLVQIAQNKFGEGLIREQDLNNIKATRFALKDKLTQLQLTLAQQENALKILCDVPQKDKLSVSQVLPEKFTYEPVIKTGSSLAFKHAALQAAYARSELRAGRWAMLPVVSAVYFQGWQHNSSTQLFDAQQPWIQSRYIGLRISMPIPADVTRLSQNYTARINHRIAETNAEHARLQNVLSDHSLSLEYEKALSAYTTASEIQSLKSSNYRKYLNQYTEGILSTDILLTAYTDMLNAKVNQVAAQAALEHVKTRVNLNNASK
jgi:outer membrane protein TolC